MTAETSPILAAILPAGGASRRYGAQRNKLLEMLGGRTVLQRSIDAFAGRDDVAMVIVPSPATWETPEAQPKVRCCTGGPSRAHSVRCALRLVPEHVEWVAIHDAARPLVSQALIDRTLTAALQHGAAAPALSVALTIRQASGPLPARAMRSIPRHDLFAMQTPQIMRRADLLSAYESCALPLDQVTDDLQLLELAGRQVFLVEGEEQNLKITTPLDLKIAELLLAGSVSTPHSPGG